jgi:hypothetical protein
MIALLSPTPFHLALLAAGVLAQAPAPAPAPAVTASVEECVPSVNQAERSATFVAQMTAVVGTQHMAMRIEVQERTPTEPTFHTIVAPGLGIWRTSEQGVKVYKYVKELTNLAAPAAFRVQVHYRWLDERGRVIKHAQRRSPACLQPVDIPQPPARMPAE